MKLLWIIRLIRVTLHLHSVYQCTKSNILEKQVIIVPALIRELDIIFFVETVVILIMEGIWESSSAELE